MRLLQQNSLGNAETGLFICIIILIIGLLDALPAPKMVLRERLLVMLEFVFQDMIVSTTPDLSVSMLMDGWVREW